jgi:hypothetical protein
VGARDYSEATRASLFAISLTCYEPDCQVPTVSIFDDGCKKNVQIAHIRAAEANGPRYNPPGYPKMTPEQRAHFTNLILLCDLHHPLADKPANQEKYTVKVLHEWKEKAEVDLRAKIDGLDRLTEARLDEMLTLAAESTKSQISEAISSLKDVSEGAAEILRTLFEQIETHMLDSESIALLHAAAHRLYYLEEGSHTLHSAAQRLYYLEEGSHILHSAAQQLNGLETNANTLASAANKLEGVEHVAAVMATAAEQVTSYQFTHMVNQLTQFTEDYERLLHTSPRVPDISGAIDSAGAKLISRLEDKAEAITIGEPTMVIDDRQRWRWGYIGFASGVVFGVLAVMITVWILAANHKL